MKVYTDPRIFDMAGAVEKLPLWPATEAAAALASGTTGGKIELIGRSKSVSNGSAGIGECSAVIGNAAEHSETSQTLYAGSDRQQKPHPAGMG